MNGVLKVLVADAREVSEWRVDNGHCCRIFGFGKLSNPNDVAVLSNNKIAIADTNNQRICIYDLEGAEDVTDPSLEFKTREGGPVAIAADAYGHLLVLQQNSPNLTVYTSDGTFKCLGFLGNSDHKSLDWFGDEGVGRLAITTAGRDAGNMDAALVFVS